MQTIPRHATFVADKSQPALQMLDFWDSDWTVHWNGVRWLANNSNSPQWHLWAPLVDEPITFDSAGAMADWIKAHPNSSDIPSALW